MGAESAARSPSLTPLSGRDAEWAKLAHMVAEGRTPITLIGPPGVGKTRLARAFASAQPGAVVIDLAHQHDEASLLGAILEALDLGGASTVKNAAERVAAALRHRTLVVLDNAEHLARPLGELLARWQPLGCPTIVTSRAVLSVPGEHLLELAPLGTERDGPAVALFREAVKRLTGEELEVDARLLEAIVGELDGLPLAIELAAAWVRVLPPERLLERLRKDRFALLRERHHSRAQVALQAAIEGSWALLADNERKALRAVCVFRGPFDLEAAEAVWGGDVLDLLARLRDASLVTPYGSVTRGMFSVLSSIRAFASARAAPESSWGERHATYFLALADRHRWAADTGDAEATRALFEARHDLLAIATREEHLNDALRAAIALSALVETEGAQPRYEEALRRALESARGSALQGSEGEAAAPANRGGDPNIRDARPSDPSPSDPSPSDPRTRGRAARLRKGPPLHEGSADAQLIAEGELALSTVLRQRGLLEESEALAREALHRAASAPGSLARARLEGQAQRRLGMLAIDRGVPADALPALHRACAVFAADGIEDGWAIAKSALGRACYALGDLEETWRHCREALPVHERHGAALWRGLTDGYLAYVALDRDEMETARRHADAATECFVRFGSLVYEGAFRGLGGSIHHLEGHLEAALSAFGAARAAMERTGRIRLAAIHRGNEGIVLFELGQLPASAKRLGEAIHMLDRVGDPASRDLFRAYEAGVRLADGELAEGRRLLGALESDSESIVARKIAQIQRARGELEAALEAAELGEKEAAASRVAEARALLRAFEGERSADVRIALRLVRARLDSEERAGTLPPAARTLAVERDGSGFEWDGEEVSLARRPVLARLLAALAAAYAERRGEVQAPDALIAATWPGQRMRPDSAAARLHTSIGRLRRAGLGELLVHREGGYLIEATVSLRWLP